MLKKVAKGAAILSILFVAVALEGVTERYGVSGWIAVCVVMLFAYAAATV